MIAQTDLEISGTEKVLGALDRASDAILKANGEAGAHLLDIVREMFP